MSIPVEPQTEGNLQEEKPAIKPPIKWVSEKVSGVPIELFEGWYLMEHPFTVAPPETPARIVMIAGLV